MNRTLQQRRPASVNVGPPGLKAERTYRGRGLRRIGRWSPGKGDMRSVDPVSISKDPDPTADGLVRDSSDRTSTRSRRSILAAGLGGLGAVVANTIVTPAGARAATGDPVLAGHANSADTETELTSSAVNFNLAALKVTGATGSSIAGVNSSSGNAVVGTSAQGAGVVGNGVSAGVIGTASGSGPGVWGTNGYSGPGVLGETSGPGGHPAVFGHATGSAGPGVYGVSRPESSDHPDAPADAGVAGWSPSGIGVQGTSVAGEAVSAVSGTGVAVTARTNGATGVDTYVGPGSPGAAPTSPTAYYGVADGADPTGVWGQGGTVSSGSSTGVYGEGDTGVWGFGGWGVFGASNASGTGVYGFSGASVPGAPAHVGVFGYSDSGVGVYARAATGTALYVNGKVRFSRSGRVAVTAGHSSITKLLAGVTTSSYVIATPQTNRAGVFVQAVVVAAGKFTIYLNKTVAGTTYVAFLVVN